MKVSWKIPVVGPHSLISVLAYICLVFVFLGYIIRVLIRFNNLSTIGTSVFVSSG